MSELTVELFCNILKDALAPLQASLNAISTWVKVPAMVAGEEYIDTPFGRYPKGGGPRIATDVGSALPPYPGPPLNPDGSRRWMTTSMIAAIGDDAERAQYTDMSRERLAEYNQGPNRDWIWFAPDFMKSVK